MAGIKLLYQIVSMTFSVIIPTKDRPIDLQNSVSSIASQTVLADELIIVDASSDSLSEENQINCKRIVDDRIKLVYLRSKPGVNIQRNFGADNANCEIVFFQDDDVILHETCHEKMLEVYELEKNRHVGGVQGSVHNYYGMSKSHNLYRKLFLMTRISEEGRSRFLPSMGYVFVPFPKEIVEVEGMTTLLCSYYRKVFQEFRFDETFSRCTDIEISYRVSREYKLYQTPYALATHRHSQETHLNIRELNKLYLIHMHKLVKKSMPRKITNWLAYYWSIVGQIMLDTGKSVASLNPDSFIGSFEGLKYILLKNE
ncbi:MAG: glycosyltransferase family 2 protein [Nitrospirae bacterium]|nr:glycosyltransferase family 2 protein [Nitrospirota bacterium]